MGRYETLKKTMQDLHLSPSDVLRHWIISKEIDGDTLEDIFCALELDASRELQVGWFVFEGGLFAPRPNVYPNLIGVIAWLNPDADAPEGERGLILIPQKNRRKWSMNYGQTGVNLQYDGKTNTSLLHIRGKKQNNKFPAASFCMSYSNDSINAGDAFLPSINQLEKIAENAHLLIPSMMALGLDFSGKLLSSTECSSYYAQTINVDTKQVSGFDKLQECDFYPVTAF